MASIHDILNGDIIPQSGIDVAVGRNSVDFPSPVVPLLDVHLRQGEFHDDAGDPDGVKPSGALSYNSELEYLQLIPGQSGTQPITTAVYIDVYNTASANVGNLTTPTTMPLNEIRSRSHEDVFSFDDAGDFIVIWTSGTYEVTLRSGTDNTNAATRFVIRSWIEQSSLGGAFVEVDGSRVFSYHRIAAAGEGTGYVTVILEDVPPGTKVRGRVASNTTGILVSGPRSILGANSLTIRRLS